MAKKKLTFDDKFFRFSQARRDQIIKLLTTIELEILNARDLSIDGKNIGAQISNESAYIALMNIRTLLLKGFEPE